MTSDALALTEWILTIGRMAGPQGLVDQLGPRLRAEGVSVMRIRLGMRTTHPLTAALSYIWECVPGPSFLPEAPHGLETRAAYVGSPMDTVHRTMRPLRRRLLEPLGDTDHEVLHELKEQGATDYYALPLEFVQNRRGIMIFVGDDAKGFCDADIALFDAIARATAPVAEAQANYHLATAIATSYLGTRTGQRVLDGQITRGDIETIRAAILVSDIRGWTALNASRPAAEALAVANRYFEVMSDAVENNNGEILKFMGDGVLALFPSDGSPTGEIEACREAVAAAHAARGIAVLAELTVGFGVGIHVGEVLYGNVGARERLDFTILGQSVNIAARVEAFCGPLDQPVLVSDAVARGIGAGMTHVATEPLKGVDTPMALYAPS